MRQINILTLITLTLCLAAGCSPVYKTTYDFEPPETMAGRQCVNTCLENRAECYHTCQHEKQHCVDNKNLANIASQLLETLEKQNSEDATTTTSHRSDSTSECKKAEKKCQAYCDDTHRLCHQNCGGRVISNTRCVANCK